MRVSYNSIASTAVTFDGVAANPGLFTVDSSGRGQTAAFNYDAVKGYTLNSAANPAPKARAPAHSAVAAAG